MLARLAGVMLSLILAAAPVAAQDTRFVVIGTGGITGVYYPAGGAICRVVNRGRLDHGIRCSVVATAGSIENLERLRTGEFTFGIVQSDSAFDAATGSGDFAGSGPFDALRAVLALHPEPFTVLARADSGISSFADLKGKRVNLGPPGSGQRAMMEVVMDALGWSPGDFRRATELPPSEQAGAFCEGRIDAMIYTVGHPSAAVQEVTSACGAVLVPVEGPEIDALVDATPYYRRVTIPGGLYRGNDADVPTFGVGALLVTSAEVPEDLVYLTVRAVFEHLDQLRATHPAFAGLDARTMADAARGLPLHPGALRYFRDAGLAD